MTSGFAKQVAQITEQYRRRLNYVAKTAVLDVTNDANKPRAQGGRMPVDTGALRASQVGRSGSMPGEGGEAVAAALIRWQPGKDPFFAGWFMNYARPMEARYGFMRGAAERWNEQVGKAVAEAKRKKL